MKLEIKKQNTILISLLALSLAACNGGGGGGSSSSGGDTPPSPPTPPVVYSHNGLTMAIKQVTPNGADATRVNLAKTFGHTQYYLVITNKNEQPIRFSGIGYDTYFESTTTKPITTDITKYLMTYNVNELAGVKACEFNSSADYHTNLVGTTLAQGESCAYKLNAMWADNQDTTTSTFNWKMSYGIVYGEDINKYMIMTHVGKDCSLFPGAPCASAAEIESADNNQHLSYYLPNHSNAIGSSVTSTILVSLSAQNPSTGGSNTPVTNMAGDVLWVPSATAYTGSVSRYQLNYNSSTNTLTKGSFLNSYVGGTDWLKGGASSNLTGDAFFQYNYANDVNVEPMSVSSMIWYPGLDGSMYASSGNNAYGVLKVTPNGNGTFTSTKLPDDFKSPTNNIVQLVGANGNILTQDYNTNNSYCYVNNGNNSYTKTAVGSGKRGRIVNGVNYMMGNSNNFGMDYMDFSGKSLNVTTGTVVNYNPFILPVANMNDCSFNKDNYLVSNPGYVEATTQYILVGDTVTRVANINTLSDGSDGN